MISQYRRYLGLCINFGFGGAEVVEHWNVTVALAR